MQNQRFQSVVQIGEGLQSKVVKALDKQDDKHVALKLISEDSNEAHMVKNEVNCLSQMDHHNIIKLITHGQNDEGKFVAMELAEGLDVIDFLQTNGPISEALARHIFKQLLDGVDHIHQKGFCHRDIKSENIMITEGCVPKIIDFGFAAKKTVDDDNNLMFEKLGTPSYMAPEIIERAGYKGDEVDLFALTVILFQMVVGRPPFHEATKSDLFFKSQAANRPDIFWRMHIRNNKCKVSEEFKNLINSMFTIEPKNRLNLQEIAQHSWMQIEDPSLTSESIESEFNVRFEAFKAEQ